MSDGQCFVHVGDMLTKRDFRAKPCILSSTPMESIIKQLLEISKFNYVTEVNFATFLLETSMIKDVEAELRKQGLSIKPSNDDTTSILIVRAQ
jgi:hypothetical protein|tara:strand:- start:615 stop:893 length:279 start_codon:yes stop_codon:yes gene_type:complete